MWMKAGTHKKQHCVPVNSISITDSQKTSLLECYAESHAATRFDNTSQFAGI
jgi:hypothetical protein